MTITVEWESPEKRYLIANYYSGWSLSDFKILKQETDKRLVSVDYLVDALVIFHNHSKTTKEHLPPSAASINIASAFDTAPDNLNHIYIINAGVLMKIIINTAQRLAPNSPAQNMHFIETLEEALEIIDNRSRSQRK